MATLPALPRAAPGASPADAGEDLLQVRRGQSCRLAQANTAVAQAYYNKVAGVRRICTETGAGQWGSALSIACAAFGVECKVFMVRVSYDQKPYRKALMQAFGAEVTPSPSGETAAGRAILARDPACCGSLGIAISEAVELAMLDPHAKYALGSVLNHVMLHQTVIGLEASNSFASQKTNPM